MMVRGGYPLCALCTSSDRLLTDQFRGEVRMTELKGQPVYALSPVSGRVCGGLRIAALV